MTKIDYYDMWENGEGGKVIKMIADDIFEGMTNRELEEKYGLGTMCRYNEALARINR